MDHQQLEQDMRSQEPQYSEQFNMQVADLQLGQPLPEYTYGYEWQNMNFVGLVNVVKGGSADVW